MKSSVWFLKGIVCIAALTSSLALAESSGGHELGNGGDVFVCPGNKVEMVDVYEARIAGRSLDFGPAGADYKTKLQAVFNRWSEVSPLRMKRYQDWLNSFESESRFIPDSSLPNIGDEGIISIPQGCEIRQVAIQLADQDLGSFYKRYTITKDLWDRMDENNRAAMVLHELIFREAIESQYRVSLRVRYLNGILLSKATLNEYVQASIALNGLFLEWGWAGFERNEGFDRDFREYKITADSFRGQLVAKSVWLRTESTDLKKTANSLEYGCRFYEISRNGGVQFVNTAKNYCSLYGVAALNPDSKGLIEIYDFIKIENQVHAVHASFPGWPGNEFQISGIDSSAKISHSNEWSTLKVELSCTGLNSIKMKGYSVISGFSDLGLGQCTAQKTTRLNYGKEQTVTYPYQSFHQISLQMLLSEDSDWLKIFSYDGTRVLRFLIGQSQVQCEQSPTDPNGLQNCQGIPQEIACEIPVIDSNREVIRTHSECVRISDQAHLRHFQASGDGKTAETFELMAPKGQVYRYQQGFFKDTPQNLDQTAWMSIRFEGGKCIGTGEFHK